MINWDGLIIPLSGSYTERLRKFLILQTFDVVGVGWKCNFGLLTCFTYVWKFVQKLTRDFGLHCDGEVELTTLAVAHFKSKEFERIGLKALAKGVLGLEMNKCKTVTMSNWSKSHLDRRQVEYACLDAWISHAIYEGLQNAQTLAV
jgi:hypothetical protein